MADTTFVPGTVIASSWLNDVNDAVYGAVNYTIHAAETAAGVTPVDYHFPPLDIRRYGGVGNNTTNCDAALTNAIKVACCWFPTVFQEYPAAEVYIPPGDFLVTMDNPFGSIDFSTLPGGWDTRYGFGIRGDGWSSRIHWKPTGSTAKWLYNNAADAASNNALVFPSFRHMQVWMDVTGLSAGGTVNGFRCWGGGSAQGITQGFKFLHSRFIGATGGSSAADITKTGTFMKLVGTVNASEMVWDTCAIKGLQTLIDSQDNDNAVNMQLYATDAEFMYGDVLKIAAGGCVNWNNGSILMYSEVSTKYFLHIPLATHVVSTTFKFSGLYFELNTNSTATAEYSRILRIDATNQASAYTDSKGIISFDECYFGGVNTNSVRSTIDIDAATRMQVNFIGCGVFGELLGGNPLHALTVFSTKTGLRASTGNTGTILTFRDGSAIPVGNITFTDANSIARISARNCKNVLDYDRRYIGMAHTSDGVSLPIKVAAMTRADTEWPDAGSATALQVTLPKGSFLVGGGFRKGAGGASSGGSNYQLEMRNGAGTLAYCASTLANQNVEHKGTVAAGTHILMDNAVGFEAGTSSGDQTVYIIATNTGTDQSLTMGAKDYAYVLYI